MASIVWITGFSGSGKTTVSRKVISMLQEMGIRSVLLDGDDLRAIFGDKWGYDRASRIELSFAYFRLCNTLAAQGITVVISAVAMYEEIYSWIQNNVDKYMQVYLRVPEDERISRDKVTKNIYGFLGDLKTLYDTPISPDLIVENYGITSPNTAAQLIIEVYKKKVNQGSADKGRAFHWDRYYKNSKLIFEPSNFAIHCEKLFKHKSHILEIGCGNGRDSAYFSHLGYTVTAIDPSAAAINLCIEKYGVEPIKFLPCKLPDLNDEYKQAFDTVYSRFCLHAMTKDEEIQTLNAAYTTLKSGGNFFIECRSINDPLARKGEVISSTERVFGHYRRFIIMDQLERNLLAAGFLINSMIESNNLAILGDENPVVIRVHATKKT